MRSRGFLFSLSQMESGEISLNLSGTGTKWAQMNMQEKFKKENPTTIHCC